MWRNCTLESDQRVRPRRQSSPASGARRGYHGGRAARRSSHPEPLESERPKDLGQPGPTTESWFGAALPERHAGFVGHRPASDPEPRVRHSRPGDSRAYDQACRERRHDRQLAGEICRVRRRRLPATTSTLIRGPHHLPRARWLGEHHACRQPRPDFYQASAHVGCGCLRGFRRGRVVAVQQRSGCACRLG